MLHTNLCQSELRLCRTLTGSFRQIAFYLSLPRFCRLTDLLTGMGDGRSRHGWQRDSKGGGYQSRQHLAMIKYQASFVSFSYGSC